MRAPAFSFSMKRVCIFDFPMHYVAFFGTFYGWEVISMQKEEKQAGVPVERGQDTLLNTVNETFNSMVEDVRNMINGNEEQASRK
jgi:hypothetical protein